MPTVVVYTLKGNGHASIVCAAMANGVERAGYHVIRRHVHEYKEPEGDVAVLWGFVTECQNIFNAYRAQNKPVVYLDLAYWERGTHYKVSLNARHPTAYFMDHTHGPERRKAWGVELLPYRKREAAQHILLAGMSAKAAWAEKEEPVESWEKKAILEIRKYTDRKIVYRPKPSWGGGKPIEGADYSNPKEPLSKALANAYAIVTHHSNVGVEALVAGIPVFTWFGVAHPLALHELGDIERPYYPADSLREKWVNDVAYCQWSIDEMKDGTCWNNLKHDGMVP